MVKLYLYTTRRHRVSGGTAPTILTTGTRWEWSTSCAGHYTAGTLGKRCWVGPIAGLGVFAPVGILTPDRPARGRVTILTDWLSYPCSDSSYLRILRTFARLSSTSTLQNSFNWPTSSAIPNKETRTIYDPLNDTSWHRLKSAGGKTKNVPQSSYRLHQQCSETVMMTFRVSKERRPTIPSHHVSFIKKRKETT
jgi:hypothetical protein